MGYLCDEGFAHNLIFFNYLDYFLLFFYGIFNLYEELLGLLRYLLNLLQFNFKLDFERRALTFSILEGDSNCVITLLRFQSILKDDLVGSLIESHERFV